jgi:hypothetical protein
MIYRVEVEGVIVNCELFRVCGYVKYRLTNGDGVEFYLVYRYVF